MGSSLFGGGSKPDTSQYDAMVKQANERAEEARKEAELAAESANKQTEEAKRQQADQQGEIANANKNKRAAASNRFSLLLFEEDDLLGM